MRPVSSSPSRVDILPKCPRTWVECQPGITGSATGVWAIAGKTEEDTLNESKYANMKELRFRADGGVWRVAFAFDPERNAILLVAGDKSGASEKKFYKRLIEKADKRYKEHLDNL
jgi:Phage derived protein Gp49-like (DUF891)